MTNDFSLQELSTCLGQLIVFPTFFFSFFSQR